MILGGIKPFGAAVALSWGTTWFCLGRGQRVAAHGVRSPGLMVPAQGEIDDGARLGYVAKCREGGLEQAPLAGWVMGPTGGVAERIVDEGSAGWVDGGGD